MRLIGRDKLGRVSGDVDRWLRIWCAEVAHAHWRRPQDLTDQFPNVEAHPGGDFLFPIGASGYWVRIQVAFAQGVAVILEINKIDANYGR